MNRLILILLAGVAAAPGMALAGSGDLVAFRPRATYGAGTYPTTVVIADVNRDGKPDLVVGNSGDGNASVLYGRGDGYFLTRTNYSTGGGRDLVVQDINLDGKPDILAVNGNGLAFLGGNGGGTFKPAQYTKLLAEGASSNGFVSVGDFNRDGRTDVVLCFAEHGFYISHGDGRGGFGPLSLLGKNGYSDAAFTVDVNGDGNPDLMVENDILQDDGTYTSGLSILIARSDGTFYPARYMPLGYYGAYTVRTVDINFDGKPDLIWVRGDRTVAVSLAVGDGTFAEPHFYPTGYYVRALVVADMNRDGKPDLVFTNNGSDTVSVLRGNGDGTFAPRQDFPTGRGPYALAVADVNGDGFPDIVETDSADNAVSVLLGTAP